MPKISVNLVTPDNTAFNNTAIPDNYTTEQTIGELLFTLALDRFKDGKEVEYWLEVGNRGGQKLLAEKTLAEQGVHDGDTLALKASEVVAKPVPPPGPPPAPDKYPKKIDVVIKLIDLNKTEKITLETRRPISDILKDLIKKYKLETYNRDRNQHYTYKMGSKQKGRMLDHHETLEAASIPPHDTLAIYRDDIAGASPCQTTRD